MSNAHYAVPISIKGIVFENDKVWLRKNERDEWELPGGKLDVGEQPSQTVLRELNEELGFETELMSIIQANMYIIENSDYESRGVLVISYLCKLIKKTGDFEHIGEAGNAKFKAFTVNEVAELNMPEFYKEAIHKSISLLN